MTFQTYAATARAAVPKRAAWRILLGASVVSGLFVLITLIMFVGLDFMLRLTFAPDVAAALSLRTGLGQPHLIVAYLVSFAGIHFGVMQVARFVHGARYATFVGPRGYDTRRFRQGAMTAGAILMGLTGLSMLVDPLEQNLPLAIWLIWLAPALVALLIQTSAEELFFRGYLQTTLAARFASPWVWWVVPSVLFGALHWNTPAFGGNAPLVVVAATVMGLIAGDVTARTGNISLACGLHFANNVVGLLIVSMPGDLGALSLWSTPELPGASPEVRLMLLGNIATLVAAYGVYRILIWLRPGLLSDERGPI